MNLWFQCPFPNTDTKMHKKHGMRAKGHAAFNIILSTGCMFVKYDTKVHNQCYPLTNLVYYSPINIRTAIFRTQKRNAHIYFIVQLSMKFKSR